jgi:hypothetical protein
MFIFGYRKNYGKRFFAFFTIKLICGHHTPPFVRVISRCTQYVEIFEGLYISVGKADSILKTDNCFGSGEKIKLENIYLELYPNLWVMVSIRNFQQLNFFHMP